jgi:hypothetical protein
LPGLPSSRLYGDNEDLENVRQSLPSSWFAIIAILVIEFAMAAAIAYAVAQGYLSYMCADREFAEENHATCAEGFPHPLY